MKTAHARSLALSLVLVSASLASGCGDKTSTEGSSSAKAADKSAAPGARSAAAAAKPASCNLIKAESICREYGEKNVEAAGMEFLKSTCDGLKGELKTEPCPKDKRVGSCVTQEGTKVFYTEGAFPMDAATAEKSCKEGQPAGEWKAGT